ncbi:hypothetical protein VTI74DRAFT_4544 [Chaetomium olivicolor]
MALLTRILLMASSMLLSACAQNQTPGQGLLSLMVAAGKLYFGTAMETTNFDDADYQTISNNRNEFGMFTHENSLKWEVTEPQQGQFVFTQSDAVAQKVKSNGQQLRCHTLTWHSQLPSFVSSGTWTPTTLSAVITAHITNVVTHYAGQCYAWDVVNEALNDNGTFRQSVFFTTMGAAYIPLSFQVAASADPSTKLYYNDFNLETVPAKADGAAQIVQLVKDTGAKIDGVGFQAHLTVGQTSSRESLAATLSRFTALGVEVAYTELDIAHPRLPASDADREQQSQDYAAAVGSCLDVEGWVPSTFPGKGDACLYTARYEKKLAYLAVERLLVKAGAARGGASASGSTGGANRTDGAPAAVKAAAAVMGGASKTIAGVLRGLVASVMAAMLIL